MYYVHSFQMSISIRMKKFTFINKKFVKKVLYYNFSTVSKIFNCSQNRVKLSSWATLNAKKLYTLVFLQNIYQGNRELKNSCIYDYVIIYRFSKKARNINNLMLLINFYILLYYIYEKLFTSLRIVPLFLQTVFISIVWKIVSLKFNFLLIFFKQLLSKC